MHNLKISFHVYLNTQLNQTTLFSENKLETVNKLFESSVINVDVFC